MSYPCVDVAWLGFPANPLTARREDMHTFFRLSVSKFYTRFIPNKRERFSLSFHMEALEWDFCESRVCGE